MKRRKLINRIVAGPRADEALLRDMWRLRTTYLDMKTDAETDWQRFRAYCTQKHLLLVNFHDKAGTLQAFFTFAFHPVDHEGRKALIIHARYYYVHVGWRGHPAITSAGWKLLPGILRRYGLRRIYFAALTFPTSFVSLSRTFGRVYTLHEAATPPWERAILRQFARDAYGDDFDESAGIARHQNVPQGENRPVPDDIAQRVARYERMNPEWRDGCSLPIMMRLDVPTAVSTLKTSARRLVRRLKKAA